MTTREPPDMDRRTVLRSTAGVAASALAVGAGTTTAAAQEQSNWLEGVSNFDGTIVDQTGKSSVTVQVGVNANGGPFGFGPPAIRVDPGTEIVYEWVSDNHNVRIESKPDGASFAEQESTENAGYTHSTTVDTEGVYLYYCQPHLPLGMKGAIVVGNAEVTLGGGGGGGTPITIPGGDIGAALVGFGVGLTGLGALAVLGSDVVGGIRRRYDESRAIEREEVEAGNIQPGETLEAPTAEPENEIRHDEYDPIGTAGLIVIYFLILVGMWILTYFVEFLGRGPTVIG